MPFPTGTRLGPYEIESLLGVGGMGEVYRARDTRLDRPVALKVIRTGLESDDASRARFRREARVVSRLSHPNICSLFDIGEQDGADYLVMEYLEGTTLAALLAASGPPALDDVLSYAIQIADGLARAHGAGVVHRDLKPGNVMLIEEGRVKLLDFGLAKHVAVEENDVTTAGVSMPGQVVGTVAYMSPEQTQGETVDARSDIFSFGVLLYELTTGVRPFHGKTSYSIAQKINAAQPERLSTHGPALPEPLTALVQRLLEKAPDRRPQSMIEVAAELRAIAAARGLAVAPASGVAIWARMRRASRRPVVAAVVLAALAAAAGLVPGVGSRARALIGQIPVPAAWRGADPPAEAVALPRTSFEWTTQGRAYLRRFDRPDNVDRAVQAYQRAIELEPDNAFAHAGLAESFYRKHDVTPDAQWVRQATESARRAVQLNPDLAAAHAVLGRVQIQARQLDDAGGSLRRALDLDPGLVQAHLWLAEYYVASGDMASAESAVRKAVELAPDDWNPRNFLGRILYRGAKYETAVQEWQEARRLAPDNTLVLRNLGAVYHMLNRLDEAAAAFQRALEIEPTASVYSNMGTLRFFQGRYSDAAAAFERAIALNATYYLYWANLGDAYRWVPGQGERSREAYSRAISLVRDRLAATPLDPDLRSQLALYLAKTGDTAAGRDELARLDGLPKTTASAQFRAVVIHELVDNREAALRALDAALKAGYSLDEVRTEPELVKLRADPRYHRLVAGFESRTTR
jgi:serine/threonine-protein kinase